MRFVLNEEHNDDNSWFDSTVGAMYKELSDEDKKEVDKLLSGETDRIIDPQKFKGFAKDVISAKKFFSKHSTGYVIKTDQESGSINILFDSLSFDGSNDFFSIFSSANHLTLASAITSEDHVEIIAEYDIFSKLK